MGKKALYAKAASAMPACLSASLGSAVLPPYLPPTFDPILTVRVLRIRETQTRQGSAMTNEQNKLLLSATSAPSYSATYAPFLWNSVFTYLGHPSMHRLRTVLSQGPTQLFPESCWQASELALGKSV